MRSGGKPAGPSGQDVDELNAAADEVATRRPDTPEAAEAARRAVEAAERLCESEGSLPNQRRLARALWRRVSTLAVPAEHDVVERTALRCWAVCTDMLEAARGDAVAVDDVVGDLAMWAGVLVPALGSVGRQADAATVYETSAIAAGRAMGARGRHARARLMVFTLAATADTLAEERINGFWTAGHDEGLAGAITSTHEVLHVLRGYQGEGPFEVSEVARVLQVLSRLQTIAGRPQEAAAGLDEAIALLAAVAARRPRYTAFRQRLEAERDGLRGLVPDDVPVPRPPPSPERLDTVPHLAFLRAARDAGIDPDELGPTEPRARLAEDRMRRAAHDHPRFGPARGLLMAWRARLFVDIGKPDLARDLAARAVRHLSTSAPTSTSPSKCRLHWSWRWPSCSAPLLRAARPSRPPALVGAPRRCTRPSSRATPPTPTTSPTCWQLRRNHATDT